MFKQGKKHEKTVVGSRKLSWIARSLFILCCFSASAGAETLYVADLLRVGVRAEPNSGNPSLTIVTTGTALEVIQRRGGYYKVKTPSGVEGWVKSAYLSKTKPAAAKLRESQSRLSQMEKTLQQMQASGHSASDAKTEELRATLAQVEEEKAQLSQQLARLQDHDGEAPVFGLSVEDSSQRFYWLGGGLMFLLSLGFLLGVSWHRHQVTKRLGGLSL